MILQLYPPARIRDTIPSLFHALVLERYNDYCYSGKSKAVPLHAEEALEVRGGIAPTFLTSALEGGEGSASRLGRALPPVLIV
jgi:hypothetical protein